MSTPNPTSVLNPKARKFLDKHIRNTTGARAKPRIVQAPPRAQPRRKPEPEPLLATARQQLEELLAKIESMRVHLEPEYVSQLETLHSTYRRFLEATVADPSPDRTLSAHVKLEAQFKAVLVAAKHGRQVAEEAVAESPRQAAPELTEVRVPEHIAGSNKQGIDAEIRDLVEIFTKMKANADNLLQTGPANEQVIRDLLNAAIAELQLKAPKAVRIVLNDLGKALVAAKKNAGNQPQPRPQPSVTQPQQPVKLTQDQRIDAAKQTVDLLATVVKRPEFGPAAAEISKQLEERRDAILKLTDTSQREQQLTALAQDAQTDIATVQRVAELGFSAPERQTELAGRLQKATSTDARKKLLDELEAFVAQGLVDSKKAMREVQDALDQDENLPKLSKDDRVKYLKTLRFGEKTTKDARRKLIARIYKTTLLDSDFLKKDNALRSGVLDKLKSSKDLDEARKNWDTIPSEPPDRKLSLLKKALQIQCAEMGIPVPDVEPVAEPAKKDEHGNETQIQGYFKASDGKIYINKLSASFAGDFDNLLDTIIHENTHNYQKSMVDKLAKDPPDIKPGDADYYQAILFQLNSDIGHFEEGEGYLESPVERHAWLAGGEARKLFVADGKAEAQVFVDQLDKWVKENPEGASQANLYRKFVTDAMGSNNTTQMAKMVRLYSEQLKTLAAQTRAAESQPDPAQALIDEMKEWVSAQISQGIAIDPETEENYEEAVNRLFEDAKRLLGHYKDLGMKKKAFAKDFEFAKRSFLNIKNTAKNSAEKRLAAQLASSSVQ